MHPLDSNNMEMEALLSRQNAPFVLSLQRKPFGTQTHRAALPLGGEVDRCRPPGLGGGCCWSASCFAPGKGQETKGFQTLSAREAIDTNPCRALFPNKTFCYLPPLAYTSLTTA